jgi:CxxC-x17-CxxC domain-containing protein
MIEVRDQQLECVKCGNTFMFTAAEAQQFIDKGLTNVPKKCPSCRAKERAKKENKLRFEATCASCGTVFEVPFEPAVANGQPQRPLYCIEHFDQRQAAA